MGNCMHVYIPHTCTYFKIIKTRLKKNLGRVIWARQQSISLKSIVSHTPHGRHFYQGSRSPVGRSQYSSSRKPVSRHTEEGKTSRSGASQCRGTPSEGTEPALTPSAVQKAVLPAGPARIMRWLGERNVGKARSREGWPGSLWPTPDSFGEPLGMPRLWTMSSPFLCMLYLWPVRLASQSTWTEPQVSQAGSHSTWPC